MSHGPLRPRRLRLRTALVLSLLVGSLVAAFWAHRSTLAPPRVAVSAPVPYSEDVVPASFDRPTFDCEPPSAIVIERGETLAGLFADLGLDRSDSVAAVAAVSGLVDPRNLRPGDAGLAYFDTDGELTRMRLRLDRRGDLVLERASEGDWASEFLPLQRTIEPRLLAASLDGTLLGDLRRAGGPSALAFAMAEVLRYDLDFNRDLRKGDRFSVVYDEITLDGRPDGIGEIHALRYVNRGQVHEAYRFEIDGVAGYYDADGSPLRKMFLRSPLPFTRVSSRFNLRRFHPVLKRYRPHYGVDFAAPTGTPIRVTANGTVTFVGRSGGAGNLVKVRHANGFQTKYLHLSRFARGMRAGRSVRQGEVIGYVGSTGLSTGPHLDYRVMRSGKYLDPLKLENRPAEPIPAQYRAAFERHRDGVRDLLETSLPELPPAQIAPSVAELERPAPPRRRPPSRLGR
ncbi:MAG: peptidoglycan DD-metalloendopeptidase family protein [Acidobacteriota bacterium]